MWFVSATWSASLLPGISQWRPVLPPRPHARHHAPLARTESLLPNPLQTEAIRSDNSAVLVLASPGTGKTRVLRARMAYLLISKGVPSDRILTVAFSQHAVSQLRTRVGAFTDTKGMWLGTFHSICARMVRQHHELLDLPRGFAVLPSQVSAVLRPSPRSAGRPREPSTKRRIGVAHTPPRRAAIIF